jgi:hypothetical protein
MSSQTVSLTIQVPKAEIAMLRETLRLSRNRHRDPLNMIRDTALIGVMGLASSTVEVSHWKHLEDFAGKLGVESPV